MDNQPQQTALSEQMTDRRSILFLALGFLLLCFGCIPALEGSFLIAIPLVAIGCLGIVFVSIKIGLPKISQFGLGLFSWFPVSLIINMFVLRFFGGLRTAESSVIASMTIFQLFGCALTFFLFRKNKPWIGTGILFASLPYWIGLVFRDGSTLMGLPFPFSLIRFGG
jgi:hypothetical protein